MKDMKKSGFDFFGKTNEMRISKWFPKKKDPTVLLHVLHGFMVIGS